MPLKPRRGVSPWGNSKRVFQQRPAGAGRSTHFRCTPRIESGGEVCSTAIVEEKQTGRSGLELGETSQSVGVVASRTICCEEQPGTCWHASSKSLEALSVRVSNSGISLAAISPLVIRTAITNMIRESLISDERPLINLAIVGHSEELKDCWLKLLLSGEHCQGS